jgi:hypothetical protein
MIKRTLVRVLRVVADALEPQPALLPKRHGLVIEDAPPGTPAPEPFQHVEPGDETDGVNQVLARIYLQRALRRFSPQPTFHA